MVLTAHARALVAAERGMRWILVVAVRPHSPGFDRATHAERSAPVASPHSGAEPVHRVVGDLQGLRLIAERRDREHRTEDLLLEDPHLVVPLEHSRLVVEAAGEASVEAGTLPTDQHLGALATADLHVALDLLQLRGGHLRADH